MLKGGSEANLTNTAIVNALKEVYMNQVSIKMQYAYLQAEKIVCQCWGPENISI